MTRPIDIPVLVVGGGGCGLTLSNLLADLGVDFLCIERNADTTDHPRAHILNQRTMEIFRQYGLADQVYARGAKLEEMERIVFMTSLGGDGPLDRRIIGSLDGYGGGSLRERYEADSASRATNLPLNLLEPLLREEAEKRAPGRVRFHQELVDFEQDASGITARIRDHSESREYTVRARYLVAADGGKTIGRTLGVELIGPRRLRKMVNTYFTADLSPWIDDDGALIIYFINPDGHGQWAGGGLVKTGPTRWDRHSETWVFMRELLPDDPEVIDEANVTERIRGLLKLPDLDMSVHMIGRWDVQGVVARHYRFGRILLAGDAAHRHPPVSALGLNTAVGDAHNLAWKLTLVLSGKAPDALLDSYESERQPVGARVAEWALNGFRMRSLIDAAIGLQPGQGESNRAAFERLFSDSPAGATASAIVAEAMHIQRIGPQAHDMEIGYAYERGALVPDGTAPPERDPMAGIYRPTTRPGSRLPHAWIEAPGSKDRSARRSTHDLVPRADFLLIGESSSWLDAAGKAANLLGIRIETAQLTNASEWRVLCGVEPAGAVLVRPDGHVAWRSVSAPVDPAAELIAAMRSVLSGGDAR
jgi:2,4-dichlorophenol 6-monooxygenase